MNCAGIDVSKGKSMIAVMRPLGEMVIPPFEVRHTEVELRELSKLLRGLEGETRVVMEATGNYHMPVAGFLHHSRLYVSVVNAMLVHGYGNNSLRRAKTDKKDAVKLANYGLDHWQTLSRSKKALAAFAGIDTHPCQSGKMEIRSSSISKRGSPVLRRTLSLVMSVLLRRSPADAPVFLQFMGRTEGKAYRVSIIASANKFLRIYYAAVKQYLDSLKT